MSDLARFCGWFKKVGDDATVPNKRRVQTLLEKMTEKKFVEKRNGAYALTQIGTNQANILTAKAEERQRLEAMTFTSKPNGAT